MTSLQYGVTVGGGILLCIQQAGRFFLPRVLTIEAQSIGLLVQPLFLGLPADGITAFGESVSP